MKNFAQVCTIASLVFLSAAPTFADVDDVKWSRFGEALTEAIQSDNSGVQSSALQQIALYGDQINLSNNAIFDLVRIYRSSTDENTRILALMAIAKTGDSWAMDFLARSVRFEKSARVSKHTRAVLKAHNQHA